ncbi:MAG: hypothetical protein M1834_005776 [Cirrosporium novae-zelandiae]|nr:MAG: hypothetical protein M1834_005776 [Cirrosporium novae-zelandiae]
MIYSYVLPHTICTKSNRIFWVRGNTSILAVNKQISEEAIDMLYGDSTFVIDVMFDDHGIRFDYQWILPNGLCPRRALTFPGDLALSNVAKIKKLYVRIHHVDSYTGWVKYNCGAHGFNDGLKHRVEELCTHLQKLNELCVLKIELRDSERSKLAEMGQVVLEPFGQLQHVHQVHFFGSVLSGFASQLKAKMQGTQGCGGGFRSSIISSSL